MKTRIIPVIHYLDDEQTMRNARRAYDAGCDGVMLIDMTGGNKRLVPLAQDIKIEWPDMPVGVNHLGLDPLRSLDLNLAAGLDMTWTDAQPTHTVFPDEHLSLMLSRRIGRRRHDMFVGVAFKHQEHEPDPVGAAKAALARNLIPTTSGSATGRAAAVKDVIALREGIGPDAPLAIASGITPENFAGFRPHLTHVLVATGVSSTFHELDEALMRRLVAA